MTRTVSLSDGRSVPVGPLRYGAYKRLRTAVLELLADRLAAVVELTDEGVQLNRVALSQLVPEIGRALGELNDQFVRGCCEGEIELEQLPLEDVRTLYNAALEVNPVDRLIEFEKNSPAGALASAVLQALTADAPRTDGLTGNVTSTEPSGGFASSGDLYDPAGVSMS